MSVTIDYFFNHPKSLAEIAEEMNRWAGCSLAPNEYNPQDLFSRFLGMELSFGKHVPEDYVEPIFSEYQYRLSLRTPWHINNFRGMQLPTLAYIAYTIYFRLDIAGVLVYDGEHILAHYEIKQNPETQESDLYDNESGLVVRFPSHLETLFGRLPEHDWY